MVCIGNVFYGQAPAKKVNGMAIRSPHSGTVPMETFHEITGTKANYLAFSPEIMMDRQTLNFENYESYFDLEGHYIESIRLAQEAGFKILFKPHIILNAIPITEIEYESAIALYGNQPLSQLKLDKTRAAEWRGDFEPFTKDDWAQWKAQYSELIIRSAKLAQELEIEQLCVGSELRRIAILQPLYWQSLIRKVRSYFKGEILYSANWDEYDKITFWKDLDYIGIDAYFPISTERHVRFKTVNKNWYPIRKKLKAFANKFEKKIVFTEYGYRNIEYAGQRPWEHDKGKDILHDKSQENLYRAFYENFWQEEWVAGGYAWRWYVEGPKKGDTNFTIQGKPAFKTMQDWYGKF